MKRPAGRAVLVGAISPLAILFASQVTDLHAQGQPYTYTLSQSSASMAYWTTPPTERVFKTAPLPTPSDSEVRVYAAANEAEPFQIVVRPAGSATVSVGIGIFGAGITTELHQVRYVPITTVSDNLGQTGDYPDPLWPLTLPALVGVTAGQNTSFWFTVHVPRGTPAGDYTTAVTFDGVSIPVRLHVFGFAVPDDLHVETEIEINSQSVMNAYSVANYFPYVDLINRFMVEHRLTPGIPTWPGGLAAGSGSPLLTYNCAGTLTDNDGVWGFEVPAAKYLGGAGFNNGHPFPAFRVALSPGGSVALDQRPASFCGQARSAGDWVSGNNPNTPYNLEWREYATGMRNYLGARGYLGQAYWRFANEPQGPADYDGVAWYSQLLKMAAPDLRLMVAEEPRPEIYAHPVYTGAKIDTWLALLNNFNPSVSWDRHANHGESTWLYFLPAVRTPRFNPITLDHPGVDAKVAGWFLWKYRIRGLQHYAASRWSPNPWTTPNLGGASQNGDTFLMYPPSTTNTPIPPGSNGDRFVPSIRLELLRDGLEDYEYLHAIAGGQPQPGVTNAADPLVDRIVGGLTAFNRNGEYYYDLRRQMGLYIGGETTAFPDTLPPAQHARALGNPASYYINFQDPTGQPLVNPLIINGHTYLKIGWQPYSTALGFGWYGDFAQATTAYLASAPNELQRSVLYDDFGRIKSFEFDLPNGTYDVTVSVGWQGRTDRHNKVVIEGIPFVDDETSSPYLVRTHPVTVIDRKLTLEMGVAGEYTMLNYLDIVVPDADGDSLPDWYEAQHPCLDPTLADAADDVDEDSLPTSAEFGIGTDPCRGDTDGGGDNDGSESARHRDPLDPRDDLAITLMVDQSGTTVSLDWAALHGSNALIGGPWFVYRAGAFPLGVPQLLAGALPATTNGMPDADPACSPCFYQVWNTRRP
ncbi:MAG TPA: DUF4091 domain-containing protein [Candidatus Polarisedimenticolia bacterium]|nr:DUF4091 domain-containing protein [Candidatus Polarisedimenticolia bacterium]